MKSIFFSREDSAVSMYLLMKWQWTMAVPTAYYLRRIQTIELFCPLHRLVLQNDTARWFRFVLLNQFLIEVFPRHAKGHLLRQHRLDAVIAGIDLIPVHVGFGNIIQRATPTIRMKAMIGRARRGSCEFLHSETVSHCASSKG